MTEESEHYTGCPKVHKSPAALLDPEPSTKHKHTRRSGLLIAIYATYFVIAKHIVTFLLAAGP
jgi:hypothetical protein